MSSSADLFASAWRHHQAQEYGLADRLYRQILQGEPRHADAWCFLGAVCQAQGNTAEAEQCYRQALDLVPGFVTARNCLGIVLAELGRLDEAAACFQQLLQLDPNDADACNNLGLVRARQGRWDEALASYQRALHLRPDFSAARANLEQAARQRGHVGSPTAAMSSSSVAVDSADSLNQRGIALAQAGRPGEAEAAFRQAIQVQPDSAAAANNLGSLLVSQRRLEEAVSWYRRALQSRPEFGAAHYNLGVALEQQEQRDAAATSYRQALRFDPGHLDAQNNLGNLLRSQGDYPGAVACYQEVLRRKPAFPEVLVNLGIAVGEQRDWDQAEAYFKEALRLRPDYAEARNALYALPPRLRHRDGDVPRPPASLPAQVNDPRLRNRTILVCSAGFDARVGGSVVLHKLCHLLRQRGLDARIWRWNDSSLTYYDTPIANGQVNPPDCVAIYPEVVTGNPLGSRHVVRWLLNSPGFFGTSFTYEESDLLITYSKQFSQQVPGCEELHIFEAWADFFKLDPGVQRSGGCFAVRKGFRKPRIPETEGLLEITDYGLGYLRELFTTREVFYCYDAMTFLSVFAAMCGCLSIVIPEPGVTKQQWHERFPLFRHGVAYGVEDRAWAEQTLGRVHKNIQEEEEKSAKQVDRLVERIAERL